MSSRKKEKPISRDDKDIEVDKTVKTDLSKATEKGTKVRAVANAVFVEYSEVDEQEEAAPRH